MICLQRINRSLSAAAQYIAAAQNEDGSFSSLSAATADYQNPIIYRTTFFTSNILAALATASDPILASVTDKSVEFLLGQKSPSWSFNYWDRGSPEFSRLPYPDDLDDTFCALSALAAKDPKLISGQALAHVVELLTATEIQPGGPYRTWLIAKDAEAAWRDVDLAVNANVAWFLWQQRVRLPGLNQFIEDRIRQRDFHSPYYPSVYPVIYFIARAYQGSQGQGQLNNELIDYIFSQQTTAGIWENPLYTALAVSALLRCGVAASRLDRAVDFLLLSAEQGWQPHAFCLDPSQNGQKYFAAASSLTAAFVWQALTLYQNFGLASQNTEQTDVAADRVYAGAVERVRRHLEQLPWPLPASGRQVLAETLRRDTDRQIGLLTYWFACSLAEFQQMDRELFVRYGAANLYGWIAYTIYDNIMDEAKQIPLLPVANVCLRQVMEIFLEDPDENFLSLFGEVMDKMEAANAWESQYTQIKLDKSILSLLATLPDYKDYAVLADKSFGHVLGPLAVLVNHGYEVKSTQIDIVRKSFRHYLIARQLNDDAHDWQEDLQQGRLNSAAVLVLRQAQEQKIIEGTSLPWPATLPRLQEVFWRQTINQISELIFSHTKQAREAALSLTVTVDTAWLDKLLRPLEQAAKTAVDQAGKAKDFLSVYGRS